MRTTSLPFPVAPGGYSNRLPGAGFRRVAGNVSEGVLIANVARDALADRYDSLSSPGKKASPPVAPARRRSTLGFRSASSLSKMPIVYTRALDSAAIFKTSARLCAAGVVAAIADDEQHFLVAAAGLQMLPRYDDGVVERRLARGRRVGDGARQLVRHGW